MLPGSELACDEAAVRLLGEPQRFAYGRTLLSFLGDGAGGREKCPGMPFMSEGGEHSVRERILALTKTGRRKRAFLAVVLAAVVLFCGCAFTGADREDRNAVGGTGMRGRTQQTGAGREKMLPRLILMCRPVRRLLRRIMRSLPVFRKNTRR